MLRPARPGFSLNPVLALLAALGSACSRDPDCTLGSLDCECRENDSCNEGLVCLSNRCVEDDESSETSGAGGRSDDPAEDDDSDPETSEDESSEDEDSPPLASNGGAAADDDGAGAEPDSSDSEVDPDSGSACAADAQCDDERPHCVGGACVECEVHSDCAAGEVCQSSACEVAVGCDDGAPDCVGAEACTPGERVCDELGAMLLECDAAGAQHDPLEDCSLSGAVCVAGACVSVTCTPGARECQGDTLVECGGDGATTMPLEVCSAPYVCSSEAGACVTDECVGGEDRCAPDGMSVELCAGTDASQTMACALGCHNGACLTAGRICHPNLLFCDAESIAQCNDVGTIRTLVSNCAGYCAESPTGAACASDGCNDGSPACAGETATMCAEDGSGPLEGGTACSEDDVCDLVDGCTPYAHEVLGSPDYIAGTSAMGGYFFRIDTARMLRGVTVVVYPADEFSTGDIVVYESDTEAGPYTERTRRTIPNLSFANTEYFVGMSTELEAGRYFFIGLWGDMKGSYAPGVEGAQGYVSFGKMIAPGHQLFLTRPESFTLEEVQGSHQFYMDIETGRP